MGSLDFDKILATPLFGVYESNGTIGLKYKSVYCNILAGEKCDLEGLSLGGAITLLHIH